MSLILMRSIPVHTGKPYCRFFSCLYDGVYPRTHGETELLWEEPGSETGLSPYTRGNQHCPRYRPLLRRSIPVHTGKPIERVDRIGRREVYPRTHGETSRSGLAWPCDQGLSPYTRGNHNDTSACSTLLWSIPVHTGKPRSIAFSRPIGQVYPRTHGETHLLDSL